YSQRSFVGSSRDDDVIGDCDLALDALCLRPLLDLEAIVHCLASMVEERIVNEVEWESIAVCVTFYGGEPAIAQLTTNPCCTRTEPHAKRLCLTKLNDRDRR